VRKDIFRQNMRYIHSHNRAGRTFKMGSNHLADWNEGERRMLRGR
jgi:hypothetical protein